MRDFKYIVYRESESIDCITLNRQQVKNAFNLEMIDEMVELLNIIEKNTTSHVIVIDAMGDDFCSGHDISESLTPEGKTIEEVRRINRVMLGIPLKIHRMEKVAIASVQGTALGFGFDLALACDLLVASDDARFSQGFLRIGLAPGMGGAWQLPRTIGIKKAAEFLFTGDFLSSAEADRLGMITRLVPRNQLKDQTEEIAGKIAKGPPAAIKQAKYLLYNSLQTDFSAALDFCNIAETMTLFTNDFHEAEKSFKEKRNPKFEGR